jgi:hypothetical protein
MKGAICMLVDVLDHHDRAQNHFGRRAPYRPTMPVMIFSGWLRHWRGYVVDRTNQSPPAALHRASTGMRDRADPSGTAHNRPVMSPPQVNKISIFRGFSLVGGRDEDYNSP